jgi:hypothetical protein
MSFREDSKDRVNTHGDIAHGDYVWSEADLRRTAPEPERLGMSASDDEEEEDADMEEVGDVKGPAYEDTPKLKAWVGGAGARSSVYCLMCHTTVDMLQFNLCPNCHCTDATIRPTDDLAVLSMAAPTASGRKILDITLSHAVS